MSAEKEGPAVDVHLAGGTARTMCGLAVEGLQLTEQTPAVTCDECFLLGSAEAAAWEAEQNSRR